MVSESERTRQRSVSSVMALSKTGFRDIIIAFLVGLAAESCIVVRAFITGGDLKGDHPWLRIFQTPGAEIALQFFGRFGPLHRYAGVFQAQACAILIQSFIFGSMTLGIIYAWRLSRGSVRF